METIEFQGLECAEIANEHISVLATISVGPRILSVRPSKGDNLLAVLPESTLEYPGQPPFHFYGGHRLWHAPENPRITYLPDDSPVGVEVISNGLRLTQAANPMTTVEKVLEVHLASDLASVELRHTLTNHGDKEQTLAPWAITQLKPGGLAILPQSAGSSDGNPTLPNRTITLWTYTDINSQYITWGNDNILVRALMTEGRLKVGFPNPAGWMAYWIDDTLFVKRASFVPGAEYFDRGSSSECYCDPRFLELETIAPITLLSPGESIGHVEHWELHEAVEWSDDLAQILAIVRKE